MVVGWLKLAYLKLRLHTQREYSLSLCFFRIQSSDFLISNFSLFVLLPVIPYLVASNADSSLSDRTL